MKTIKIIDLLTKIENGEEVPNVIKVGIHKFYKCRKHNVYDDFDYQNENGEYLLDYLSEYEYITKYLSNEVEILDEEDEFEDIEELDEEDEFEEIEELEGTLLEPREDSNLDTKILCCLANTMNNLIKNQKKIIERLKDGD